MKATGRHLLVEYRDCDRTVLNDLTKIEELMRKAAEAADAVIVGSVFHPFTPQGVSGVVVIEESHLSVHTWPEYGYAAVDFFTCGKCHPEQAHDVLMEGLGAARSEKMLVMRGQLDEPSSMQVARHESQSGPNTRDHAESIRDIASPERSAPSLTVGRSGRR